MINLSAEPISTLLVENDLAKCPTSNDLLHDEIKLLREENSVVKGELQALLDDLRKYRVFSDGIKIEELREEVDVLKAEIAKLKGARKPGYKQAARLAKLDQLLLSRNNEGMTFSEIGKILELGSRAIGKNTRRQAMTKFSKSLDPKNYEVFASRTQGGKMVKLTREYAKHLRMQV